MHTKQTKPMTIMFVLRIGTLTLSVYFNVLVIKSRKLFLRTLVFPREVREYQWSYSKSIVLIICLCILDNVEKELNKKLDDPNHNEDDVCRLIHSPLMTQGGVRIPGTLLLSFSLSLFLSLSLYFALFLSISLLRPDQSLYHSANSQIKWISLKQENI